MSTLTITPRSAPATPLTAVLGTALRFVVACQIALERTVRRVVARLRDDRGQATTEYALVLLAAALVALLVIAWATAGGGGARINRLFNRVVDAVIDRV